MAAVKAAMAKGFVPVKVGAFTYALVYKGNLNGDIVFIKPFKGTVAQYRHTTRYGHFKNKKALKNYYKGLKKYARDFVQFTAYHL